MSCTSMFDSGGVQAAFGGGRITARSKHKITAFNQAMLSTIDLLGNSSWWQSQGRL